MLEIKIEKTFNSQEECDAWKEKNMHDNTYMGRTILMIRQSESVFDNKVTLKSVFVI